jgi:hypothetical protein
MLCGDFSEATVPRSLRADSQLAFPLAACNGKGAKNQPVHWAKCRVLGWQTTPPNPVAAQLGLTVTSGRTDWCETGGANASGLSA